MSELPIKRSLVGHKKKKDRENYGRRLSRQKTVLFIEDDSFLAHDYGTWMKARGFHVTYAYSVDEAILQAKSYRHFDFVVVDIKMPHGSLFDSFESVGGRKTGVLLATELLNDLPDAAFVALTNSEQADDRAWFEAHDFAYHVKREIEPKRFAAYLRRRSLREKPRVFIVHGHDHRTVRELKHYLQHILKFEEPVVLWERKSAGMTVIEKFERYASEAEVVFVLMTPDDYVDGHGQGRARQNVIYEFGYFQALLGRGSGKVIVLYKEGVEMPSDLGGTISIDISNGISAVGDQIRKELLE
jgi:CheY-like chemotaxis protein